MAVTAITLQGTVGDASVDLLLILPSSPLALQSRSPSLQSPLGSVKSARFRHGNAENN